MKTTAKVTRLWWIILFLVSASSSQPYAASHHTKDIRKLSQHFTDPKGLTPWIFVPQDNIKSVSATEHPGFVTIWEAGKGKDIKGILKDPIHIDAFPLPWEFHLGLARLQAESNYAIGLNLVLTFSDPSTWPKDRTELPPDTHAFQLLDVHLKLPQLKSGPLNYDAPDSGPDSGDQEGHGGDPFGEPGQQQPRSEVYLVYGRGDLDPNVVGNWKIPYIWEGYPTGAWEYTGGPASHSLSFRVKLVSPTSVEVGFFGGLQGEPHLGWRMRTIDVSRFGKITGIWEIGPIISLDRWLPDRLAPELGLSSSPPIKVADPSHTYYMVDYGVFFGAGPKNVEHMSDDFDIPGFHAKWYHEAGALVDTYSHPGYLTVTLLAQGSAAWAMCPTSIGTTLLDLSQVKAFPGYEFEIGFIPPDNTMPWNLYMSSFTLWDERGKPVGYGSMPFADPGAWHAGVQYFPEERKHGFINIDAGPLERKKGPIINVEFEPEVPESILSHKPLYMLVQMLDASHLRVGLKANQRDPWYLSKTFDTSKVFGRIGKFNPHTCVTGSVLKGKRRGSGAGNFPRYPQFLIDYVHFRYGLSTPK